jgi:hypothetical protein
MLREQRLKANWLPALKQFIAQAHTPVALMTEGLRSISSEIIYCQT